MKIKTITYLAACLPIMAIAIPNIASSSDKYEFRIPVEMAASGEPKPDSEAWRQFFLNANSNFGKRTSGISISGIETKELWTAAIPRWRVTVYNASITDSEIPAGTIGLQKTGYFGFSGNKLTNVNFFKGVKDSYQSLEFQNNMITSLKGFSDLETQADMFQLQNNKFTSLDGLQKLKKIRTLSLYKNPQLVDISAIEGLESYGLVALDDVSQYKKKPRKGSVFCNSIKSQKIYAKVRKDSPTGGYIDGPFLTVDQVCM